MKQIQVVREGFEAGTSDYKSSTLTLCHAAYRFLSVCAYFFHFFFSSLFQYSDTALYTQLLYYSRLFDYDHAIKNAKDDKTSE